MLLLLRSESDRKSLVWILKRRMSVPAAYVWRRLLIKTTFIAISGSVGKTTTKEFLADMLDRRYPTVRTPGNWGGKFGGIEFTILKARPWHRFVVVEIGIETPGQMRSYVKLVKPDIALMLGVKHCHTNAFKTIEAIAEEKAQLLYGLRHNGCAVINQDDAHVAEMASNLDRKIIRFGSEAGVDFRLHSAESRWPNRLTVEIEANGRVYKIVTRLVGEHWTPTIMASLATATLCGVPIETAVDTMGSIEPFWARMQPITLLDSGATIIREDWNGSIDTFETAFKVMKDADASRKIVVFSDFSDSKKKLRRRANYLGQVAARLADVAIFVGEYADQSVKAAISEGFDPESAHGFFSIAATTDFLRDELRNGDLVLIKGQANHHLSRIYLGLLGEVKCTKPSCSKQILCDRCPELGFKWRPELKDYMAAPGSMV